MKIKNEVIKEVLPEVLEGTLQGVYGKAGVGKTTFCIHIAKEYIEKNKKVAYIDTEHGLFIERVLDIIESKEYLNNLLIKKVFDLNELRNAINEIKENIPKQQIDLIIIDSLSNPYRVEMKDQGNVWELNRIMGKTIHQLKKISFHHNIPILATHQVYTDFETGEIEVVGRDLIKYDFKVMIRIDKEKGKINLKLTRHPYLSENEISGVIKKEGFRKKKIF